MTYISLLGEELAYFAGEMCINIPKGAYTKLLIKDIVNDVLENENDSKIMNFVGKEYLSSNKQ